MYNKYKENNERIEERFKRAEKYRDSTEMYAARDDFDKNIEKQREMLSEMDKNSPEYRQLSDDIREQEYKFASMGCRARDSLGNESSQSKLEGLKRENDMLEHKMHQAVESGNTKAYDEARQRFETNIKAQDSLSKQMKMDGIEHENTTTTQNIHKQQLDEDMAGKMRERIEERTSKGKQPNPKDQENFQKYSGKASESMQENLKRYDDAKLDKMQSYGLSEEEIAKERREMEHQRERYR